MEEERTKWKEELIAAGKLDPDAEISDIKLAIMYQDYQIEKMKSGLSGTFAGLGEHQSMDFKSAEDLGLQTVVKGEEEKETNVREGIKQALNALLTQAEGASYCMIVVSRAWINFRYKRRKNNLHLQVAGNQYITPLKLEEKDIKQLEKMGIPPEPMSVEIYACDFDEEPRDLEKIVDTAITIFNDIYHVSNDDDAYVELDLGKGANEKVMQEILKYFSRRSGNKFKWSWDSTH